MDCVAWHLEVVPFLQQNFAAVQKSVGCDFPDGGVDVSCPLGFLKGGEEERARGFEVGQVEDVTRAGGGDGKSEDFGADRGQKSRPGKNLVDGPEKGRDCIGEHSYWECGLLFGGF